MLLIFDVLNNVCDVITSRYRPSPFAPTSPPMTFFHDDAESDLPSLNPLCRAGTYAKVMSS
jgi:hypothetical protein